MGQHKSHWQRTVWKNVSYNLQNFPPLRNFFMCFFFILRKRKNFAMMRRERWKKWNCDEWHGKWFFTFLCEFFFPFDVGKCFRYMLCIPAIIQCFDEFMTFSFLRKKENSKPALDQQMVATEPLMKWCNFVGGKFHYFFCSLEFHFWWSLIP